MLECIYKACACFGFMLFCFVLLQLVLYTENKDDGGTEEFQCLHYVCYALQDPKDQKSCGFQLVLDLLIGPVWSV